MPSTAHDSVSTQFNSSSFVPVRFIAVLGPLKLCLLSLIQLGLELDARKRVSPEIASSWVPMTRSTGERPTCVLLLTCLLLLWQCLSEKEVEELSTYFHSYARDKLFSWHWPMKVIGTRCLKQGLVRTLNLWVIPLYILNHYESLTLNSVDKDWHPFFTAICPPIHTYTSHCADES